KIAPPEKSEEMERSSMNITSFFKKVDDSDANATNDEENDTDADTDEKDEERAMSIEEALSKLSGITAPHMNQKTAAERQLSDYELDKHRGIMVYFMGLLNGKKKTIASQEAAKVIWANPYHRYYTTAVRVYAKGYLRFGSLAPHQQGKHVK
ncbi:hypothetical protein DFQ30_002386, partial [Apophysomyces sp. BC1015]